MVVKLYLGYKHDGYALPPGEDCDSEDDDRDGDGMNRDGRDGNDMNRAGGNFIWEIHRRDMPCHQVKTVIVKMTIEMVMV